MRMGVGKGWGGSKCGSEVEMWGWTPPQDPCPHLVVEEEVGAMSGGWRVEGEGGLGCLMGWV